MQVKTPAWANNIWGEQFAIITFSDKPQKAKRQSKKKRAK
jgi:hypothetical protein